MKLKVCGMKFKDNIQEIAMLEPDYMGFIFHEKSPRFFESEIPEFNHSIQKIGVFVNASISEIIHKINKHHLNGVQLHGTESPEYCEELKKQIMEFKTSKNSETFDIEIIKVFSIKDTFNFEVLQPYELVCDYYLFDTKGKLPGGNGYTFNWNTLKAYPSTKPYFLSGGIGLDELKDLREFAKSPAAKYCHAVDVNSKFELQPGKKNINNLKTFRNDL